MSYLLSPVSYITTIAKKYPGVGVSCAGDGTDYSLIDWGANTPIAQATLDADRLDVYKEKIIQKIRVEAEEARENATIAVLGTADQEQLRTYDEKYKEAVKYVADNLSPTPIMSAETAHTGETVAALAPVVVAQYEGARAILDIQFGNIEGIRRKSIADVTAFTTLAEAQAYTGPVWS